MRTIAGQIQAYQFPNVTEVQTFETYFTTAWGSQIGGGVEPEATNIGGNEHFGATLNSAPLPDLAQDVVVPQGSAMAVYYAIDQLVVSLNALWIIVTIDKHRVRVKDLDPAYQQYGLQPDPQGPYELKDLTVTCQGTTWSFAITGIYHVGHKLPDVPFTVTFQEEISVDATVPTSTSLRYRSFPPTVKADTGKLLAAIHALEAVGAGLAGLFGIPLFAFGLDYVAEALQSELRPVSGSLDILKTVFGNMPQRFPFPGSADNIVFHYDSVSMPQGIIASSGNTDGVTIAVPGSIIQFVGKNPPVRNRRIAFVTIEGPAAVNLPPAPHSAAAAGALPAARSYFAEVNDEVENPTFTWSLTSPSGAAAKTVALSSSQGQQVQLFFNHNNAATPPGTYVLKVTEDDTLHLTDAQGHPPAAELHIVVTQAPIVVSKPNNGKLMPRSA